MGYCLTTEPKFSYDVEVNGYFQGVKLDKGGNVIVDEFQNTNIPGVYSVGDVQGKFLLTPGKNTS